MEWEEESASSVTFQNCQETQFNGDTLFCSSNSGSNGTREVKIRSNTGGGVVEEVTLIPCKDNRPSHPSYIHLPIHLCSGERHPLPGLYWLAGVVWLEALHIKDWWEDAMQAEGKWHGWIWGDDERYELTMQTKITAHHIRHIHLFLGVQSIKYLSAQIRIPGWIKVEKKHYSDRDCPNIGNFWGKDPQGASPDSCKDTCLKDTRCTAFSYHRSYGCTLRACSFPIPVPRHSGIHDSYYREHQGKYWSIDKMANMGTKVYEPQPWMSLLYWISLMSRNIENIWFISSFQFLILV